MVDFDVISDENTTPSKAKIMKPWGDINDSSENTDEDYLLIKRDWGDHDEDVETSVTTTSEADTDSSSIIQRRLTVLVKATVSHPIVRINISGKLLRHVNNFSV